MESVRVEAEVCDGLQSILMIQSTGGGTGSGLGSYISELVRDELPEVWRFTTCVVPSETDDVVISPYNSILSLSKIAKSSDCLLPIDNQSLFDIYSRIKKYSLSDRKPESSLIDNVKLFDHKMNEAYTAMNNIVANSLLSLTSSMRFTGTMNVDINDIVTNMVPFAKLNFLSSSMAPLFMSRNYAPTTYCQLTSVDRIFADAILPESQLLSVDIRKGTSLANSLIVRGSIEVSDLRRNIDRLSMQMNMVSWNRDGWKTGICDVPPLGQGYSVMALSNNTAIVTILDRLSNRFNKIFKRKAHLHHYMEFMDEQDFISSIQHINSICASYCNL